MARRDPETPHNAPHVHSGAAAERPRSGRPRSGLLSSRERRSSNSGLPSNSLFGSVGSPAREGEMVGSSSSSGGSSSRGLPSHGTLSAATSPSGVTVPGASDFQVRCCADACVRACERACM